MRNNINFDAKHLVHSQSPTAPFIVIFEKDEDVSVCYAVRYQSDQPHILDQVVLDENQCDGDDVDVSVHWNELGERAALIINEQIITVFDFNKSLTYFSNLAPKVETDSLVYANSSG